MTYTRNLSLNTWAPGAFIQSLTLLQVIVNTIMCSYLYLGHVHIHCMPFCAISVYTTTLLIDSQPSKK